jgi:ERCC4-related helicase
MPDPIDISPVHAALDGLRRQLCHCGLKGECLGCRGVEMVRMQLEAVTAAASQPILMQVAQEAAMKDMASRFEQMAERMMSDPQLRNAAEAMQERVMSDPEARKMLEELMRRLGNPPGGPGEPS